MDFGMLIIAYRTVLLLNKCERAFCTASFCELNIFLFCKVWLLFCLFSRFSRVCRCVGTSVNSGCFFCGIVFIKSIGLTASRYPEYNQTYYVPLDSSHPVQCHITDSIKQDLPEGNTAQTNRLYKYSGLSSFLVGKSGCEH